ncbi:MAG TPA: ATP-dependent chaperone ClpB, partial [Hyphomicrobiaceae bacterium]|nr:ATP-dependent chaperone ClpB [Hyphomicrobiaceae bacterium]
GSEYLVGQKEGDEVSAVRELVLAEVRAKFRPEFLNRLDDIVLFERLKRDQMTQIVDIQLARLLTLLADRKITLDVDNPAKAWLANKGYDPAYGARPLKRVIQRYVQDTLAELILAGTIRDGGTVTVTANGDGLVINGEPVRAAA